MDTDFDLATNITLSNNYYVVFQRDGVPSPFVALVFLRLFIAIIGLLSNASLLYVAVNTYDLQGSCNFLIAFNAFCLVIFMPFMSIGVIYHSFVPIQTCFWWQLVPLFFGNLFMISTLAIAVDRLLSVLFPSWHSHQSNEFSYLGTMLVLSILYSGCVVYICYTELIQPTDKKPLVLCLNPSDLYQGGIGTILFYLSLLIVTMCIICYVSIWIIVRKNQTKWNGTFTLKILTSLSVLILIDSFGYFLAIVLRIISMSLKSTQFVYITFGYSMVSVVAMAVNAPVLYMFSSDYQNAFREHFPRLFNSLTRHGATIANNSHHNNRATISLAVERPMRVSTIKMGGEERQRRGGANGRN